jgi:gamma-glutamylcyclotransferase (GGCT)/AIG2-like uncharacterized protein YtfP
MMLHLIFAYGTLQPGGRYWPQIQPLITHTQPAATCGYTLYHLDAHGYPCIVEGDGPLEGTLLAVRQGAQAQALSICDAIEGFSDTDPSSLYLRTTCRTDDGHTAWIYVFGPRQRHILPTAATLVTDPSWVRWRDAHRPQVATP